MQTNFLDKNGKPIHLGDTVKYKDMWDAVVEIDETSESGYNILETDLDGLEVVDVG